MRPPREDYVRVTRECNSFTAEPAVEYRDGDDFAYIAKELGHIVADWTHLQANQMQAARDIGDGIARRWPDRAYFVEVWQEGHEGFAQVFQPFGVPRNQP